MNQKSLKDWNAVALTLSHGVTLRHFPRMKRAGFVFLALKPVNKLSSEQIADVFQTINAVFSFSPEHRCGCRSVLVQVGMVAISDCN
jgi:hypothetical protein